MTSPFGLSPWQIADQEWRAQRLARAEYYRARQLAEKVARGVERTSAPRVPLTPDALIDAIGKRVDGGCGWDLLKRQQYAEHLVQQWCTCGPSSDYEAPGWDYCQHATDEGF